MSDTRTGDAVAEFLYRECRYLDQRKWDEWLGLYREDAVFWLPAWLDEERITSDPDNELSLIYYEGRENLADRVRRLTSGQSAASKPLHRTAHMVSNVVIDAEQDDAVDVHSVFTVHRFNPKRNAHDIVFGHYEHRLRRSGEDWRIARKKIVLLNDYIPAVLDIYVV